MRTGFLSRLAKLEKNISSQASTKKEKTQAEIERELVQAVFDKIDEQNRNRNPDVPDLIT
jgi:tRNA U54 and U55 pseudouridine synthase Pus10